MGQSYLQVNNELVLRVVMESDYHGREYFGHYDNVEEMLAAIGRLVQKNIDRFDGVERIVGIAIIPPENCGQEDSYGYGIDLAEEGQSD